MRRDPRLEAAAYVAEQINRHLYAAEIPACPQCGARHNEKASRPGAGIHPDRTFVWRVCLECGEEFDHRVEWAD